MKFDIQIDLKGISSDKQLFQAFNNVFGFPDYFGNNWSALRDVMGSLDSDARIISQMNPLPTHVHLVILNIDLFEANFPKSDLSIFESVLFDLCSEKRYRYDNISFTFELRYSEQMYKDIYGEN